MILVQDNFLPKELFGRLQEYCYESDFQVITAGDKEFLTIPTPDWIIPQIGIDNSRIVLSFIRKAHKDFDTELRVHADNIIMEERVDYAVVLYINDSDSVSKNGTKFWEHTKYGESLPLDISEEEYNYLILNDSNDYSKWNGTDLIYARPNRLLMYNAQNFHSKFPEKIEKGERIVLVAFYKKYESDSL